MSMIGHKRKAKNGETPSPQMEKKQLLCESGSNSDTETEDNEINLFSTEGKSDSEMLAFLCTKVNGIMSQLKKVNAKQDKIMKKLKGLEKTVTKHSEEIEDLKNEQQEIGDRLEELLNSDTPFDPEVILVAINTPYYSGEDPTLLAKHLLKAVDCSDKTVVNVLRTPQRNNRAGILKIQLQTKQDKIDVLRRKVKLKDSVEFRNVYIRSSKSNSERLMETNIRTILNEIPNGGNYRIAGNGCVVKKDLQSQAVKSVAYNVNQHPTYAAVTATNSSARKDMTCTGASSRISPNTTLTPGFPQGTNHVETVSNPREGRLSSQVGAGIYSQMSQNSITALGFPQGMSQEFDHQVSGDFDKGSGVALDFSSQPVSGQHQSTNNLAQWNDTQMSAT